MFLFLKLYEFDKLKLNFIPNVRRQGWLMTLNLQKYKQMNYRIPNYLKLWYGDDWLFQKSNKQNY